MTWLDYSVLIGYFVAMAVIGLLCMLKIKAQEDFFMGGRSFGRILQAFAAFGAGTGSNDPVTLGRTTYTSGLSGIWGVLLWLFVTPFYWIFGVWYRRMRHLTLGDWFVERYESKGMGVAYTLFAICFYMMYLSVGFSAVGKVCAPLIGQDTYNLPGFGIVPIETVLVPIIALVVVVYGVLGGLRAAYWTDLIQGIFIILLSIILIPYGLQALVTKFGDPATMGMMDGFRIMHEQVPAGYFEIVESPRGGEFPLYYIAAITLINLVGIVVQPHFIATGGGSAKTENAARVGLVAGNFMKRFCTVGWALTVLIVLALLADNVEIARDPDRVWGVAAREILGPLNLGLVGLMLACLLAALMSSADCYMIVASALVVRNVYAPFINPAATEKAYINVGRVVGFVMILGGVIISLAYMDVFAQLKVTWEMPIIFAAPFWIGMFWRRSTKWAAWLTVLFSTTVFFVLPMTLPTLMPGLRTDQRFVATNDITTTTIERKAAPADAARRRAAIEIWQTKQRDAEDIERRTEREAALAALPPAPKPIAAGDQMTDVFRTGGKPIFWTVGVVPIGQPELEELSRDEQGNTTIVRERHVGELRGEGYFNLDLLLYSWMGWDLTGMSNAAIQTLRLPPKVITPFIVIFLLSLITPRDRKETLDRYYVKMKTPVLPDHDADARELEESYRQPDRYDDKRLFPAGTGLEILRPKPADIIGFVLSFFVCFLIIGLTIWIAKIGS